MPLWIPEMSFSDKIYPCPLFFLFFSRLTATFVLERSSKTAIVICSKRRYHTGSFKRQLFHKEFCTWLFTRKFTIYLFIFFLLWVCVCLKDSGHYYNCQRPVFSLALSQHMHKITKPDFSSIGHRSCETHERKSTLAIRSCVLSDAWFGYLKF